MPHFQFRYVDQGGTQHDGQAEADDRESLLSELRSKGMILELNEVQSNQEKREATEAAQIKISLPDFGFSKDDLALYTRQLATMLTAGLPIMKILSILRKRCPSKSFGNILDEVSRDIQGGMRFSDSLQKHPHVFDGMYVNLVKVGEASGKMADMVERLATLLDKDASLQRRIKSAMAYPIFILAFTVLLSWVIVAFLMPLFTPMFTSSGLNIERDYPLTYWLMVVSHLATNPIYVILGAGVLVGAWFGLKAVGRTTGGRLALDNIVFRIPFVNTLFRFASVARFARTLSTLMGSGLPLLQALSLVGGASGNAVIAGAVERVANQISKGKKISDAIDSEAKTFPDLLIQMVQVGEESGALPAMLERAADYYDTQMDSAVARLVAMLEPGMMVVVGGIVCGFVMAVLLPILGLAKLT